MPPQWPTQNSRRLRDRDTTGVERQLDEQKRYCYSLEVELSETADHLKYAEDRVRDLEGLLNRRRQERGEFKQREGMFQTEIMRLQRHIQGISQPISPPAGAEEALDSRLSQKNDEISKLEQEIQEYKVAITKSTRLEGQLSDTRIQIKINDLFSAVRNWALEVVRREKPEFHTSNQKMSEWLRNQVPDFQGNFPASKMNSLIAIFSGALAEMVNEGSVFGRPLGGPLASAHSLYNDIPVHSNAAQQKKARWVSLTKELLMNDEDADAQAERQFLLELVRRVQKFYGEVSNSSNATAIGDHLRAAIEPHIGIVQTLFQQEAEYTMDLPAAINGNALRKIDTTRMDEVNGEDGEEVQACFFPMLIKQTFESGDAETMVVCKAKILALSQVC